MNMKRFFAESARECLRKVKEELGSEAIVVSNKSMDGGVEMLAMSAAGLKALSGQASPGDATGSARAVPAVFPGLDEDYTVTLSSHARKEPAMPSWQAQAQVASQFGRPPLRPLPARSAAEEGVQSGAKVAAKPRGVLQDEPAKAPQVKVSQLMGEMRSIKSLLERQLSGFAWGEMSREAPVRALALAEMLDAGFSGQLTRNLCQEMPAELNIEEARKWLQGAINRRLRTLGDDNDIIAGGIYALQTWIAKQCELPFAAQKA